MRQWRLIRTFAWAEAKAAGSAHAEAAEKAAIKGGGYVLHLPGHETALGCPVGVSGEVNQCCNTKKARALGARQVDVPGGKNKKLRGRCSGLLRLPGGRGRG